MEEETKGKILNFVEERPMSLSQLSKELNIRRDILKGYLESLKEEGKIDVYKVGRYQIFFSREKRSRKLIGIVSGKGGVGKTFVTINLGLALTDLGEDVVVIDGDLTTSSLALQLGYHALPFAIQHAMLDKTNILDLIYKHPTGLKFIPSSLSLKYHMSGTKLRDILSPLRSLILIDSPPGLGSEAMNVIECCDDFILVTNPELHAVAQAIKVSEVLKELNKNLLGVIVNRITKFPQEFKAEDIASACDTQLLAKIPEDKNVRKSIWEGIPILRYKPLSKTSIEFMKLASLLSGKPYEPPRFLRIRRLLGWL